MEKIFENDHAALRLLKVNGTIQITITDKKDGTRQLYNLNKSTAVGMWLFLDTCIDQLTDVVATQTTTP